MDDIKLMSQIPEIENTRTRKMIDTLEQEPRIYLDPDDPDSDFFVGLLVTSTETVRDPHTGKTVAKWQGEITNELGEIKEQLELSSNFNYAVCSTPGNVAAKTVEISPFVLSEGVEVTIDFKYQSTTPAVTLNVSGYGAKPVMYKGAPLQGELLTGLQKLSYDGSSWNIVGDIDTDTDTTYDILNAEETLTGSSVTPKTINALNLKQAITQISGDIVNASLADSYDVNGLQASLNNLIFRLVSQGIIDGDGLDTVVVIDSPDDVVLVSGMYSGGKVYI